MAFSARRSLASSLSHHLTRRLYPSLSHLLTVNHHDHNSDDPSPSSAPPPPPPIQPPPFLPSAARRPSRSHALTLPFLFSGLHHAAHRNFSTSSSSAAGEIDPTGEVLSDAASSASVLPAADVLSDAASSVSVPVPFVGEVAVAAADSFPPVAALQYLIDGVHSFTGLNWWACIALTTVLIRTATIPLLINQMKSTVKLNAMRPEIEAINAEMRLSPDPQSMQEGKRKLGELFLKHGVTPLTPLKALFIQGPIFMSFFFAISNMVEKVPSFKEGGAYWFTDLTTADPFCVLPVLTSLAFLATVELNMQEGMEGNPMLQTMKKFSRVLAVMTVPFTMSFPKAIFFYWITSNLFSLAYGFVLRKPIVRSYLDLPRIETPPAPAQQPVLNLFGVSKSTTTVDSPIVVKGSEEPSSVLSDRIKDLENKAKSRSETQE